MGQRRVEAGGSTRWVYWSLATLAAVLVLGGALLWRAAASGPREVADARPAPAIAAAAPAPARRETRPTLDPARFVGKARAAHQVAREIPDVLDRLYCYCECDKQFGHKSLLSCYTDSHAAT